MPDPATRRLNTLDATLLVMGGIIGVGIFFTPHMVAQRAFETWAFLAMWLIGGGFALAAALTFAEWGASFPEAGGWYVFLRESLGRFPAFLFAWIVLFVVSTGAIASVAMFAASAIDAALPWVDWGGGIAQAFVAAGLITAVTLACLLGVKSSAMFQNAIMAIKLTAVAALLVAGFAATGFAGTGIAGTGIATTPATVSVVGAAERSLWTGMGAALLPVFYAYGGWQMVCYIAPQVENPARTLPRAIIAGVCGVIVVYLLLAVAYVRVLGLEGIATDQDFAMTLGDRVFGASGEALLSAGLAISALGFLVVTILGTPWLYVAMARERLFFAPFAALSTRGAPACGLALQWVVSIAYLGFSLSFLVDAVVFAEWVFHGLVAWGLIRFRRAHPTAPRPFRSPLFPLAPLVYLAAAVLAVSTQLLNGDTETTALGCGVIAVGVGAYLAWTRIRG